MVKRVKVANNKNPPAWLWSGLQGAANSKPTTQTHAILYGRLPPAVSKLRPPPPPLTRRMCVLNTESPIFACLPRAEGKPIVLVPDSDGTEAGSGGGSSGNRTTEINHGGREWSGSPWLNAHSDDLSVGGVSAAPSAVVARTYKSNCGRWEYCFAEKCSHGVDRQTRQREMID